MICFKRPYKNYSEATFLQWNKYCSRLCTWLTSELWDLRGTKTPQSPRSKMSLIVILNPICLYVYSHLLIALRAETAGERERERQREKERQTCSCTGPHVCTPALTLPTTSNRPQTACVTGEISVHLHTAVKARSSLSRELLTSQSDGECLETFA